MNTILRILFAILLLLSQLSLAEDKPHKKVGLVLAGGGALGFAHIGVLKVLREENVPVHMVAGTSMGAIIGAAYASGRTIEEMEEVLTSTDWDELFDESVDRESKPYRLKSGRNRELYSAKKFGFKEGSFQTSMGVVEGQKVRPLLQSLYHDVPDPVKFDHLPVPFRAVAADIETGTAYIPEEGSLSTMVRASMSVPGFFSPVRYQGRILVDGGIANNLPVDVVQEMGADVLIVVELYADLSKAEELKSPFAISGQILSLLLAQNAKIQKGNMRPEDVFVAPDLTGYSSTDFAKGLELIKLGEEAARKIIPQLKKLSVGANTFSTYEESRTKVKRDSPKVDFVKIENKTDVPDRKIRSLVNFQEGDSFDTEQIEKDLGEIYDLGLFNSVTYDYIEEEGENGIVVKTEPTSWHDQFLRLGFALEDDFDGNNFYRLGAAFRNNHINSLGAYLEHQIEIGKSPYLQTELYQPLGTDSPYFINPLLSYGRTAFDLRLGGEDVAEYFRRHGKAELNIGRELGTFGEFLVGVRRGFGELERDIGNRLLPEPSYDVGEFHAQLTFDTLDQPDVPSKGFMMNLSYASAAEELGDSDDFNTLSSQGRLPYSWGKNTLMFAYDLAETFEDRPSERYFTLGGFQDISGYQPNDLYVSDYKIGRILYARKFSEGGLPFMNYGFYAGASLDFAHMRSDAAVLDDPGSVTGGSIFLALDTPILPLYLAYGLNDDDEKSLYLVLGRLAKTRTQ